MRPDWSGAPEVVQLRRRSAGRIIVASSSAQARRAIGTALEFEGHEVTEAETADQTVQKTCSGRHDLLILDSDIGGVRLSELCRTIRPKSDLGIIVLNRDDTEQTRIDVLNAGADDYVPALFVFPELLARVRAILRRVIRSGADECQVLLQDRSIDFRSHKIKGPGETVGHLTPKEFLVLECLINHVNKPLTHHTLSQTVWQRDGIGDVEYLRTVIRQLRRKLEPNPDSPRYILTERFVGYRFQMAR